LGKKTDNTFQSVCCRLRLCELSTEGLVGYVQRTKLPIQCKIYNMALNTKSDESQTNISLVDTYQQLGHIVTEVLSRGQRDIGNTFNSKRLNSILQKK